MILKLFGAPKPNIIIPDELPPAPPLAHPPRVALVLGGGGARGFAHVGVLKVLEQAKVPIDLIVGASAGTIAGAIYADTCDVGMLAEHIKTADKEDFLDIGLLQLNRGIFTGRAIQNFILRHLKARDFSELKLRFVAVAADLATGFLVPIESGPIAPAVQASSALIPFFHAVKMYGMTLIDGGIIDPVPVRIAHTYNPKLTIAVEIGEQFVPKNESGLFKRTLRGYRMTMAELSDHCARHADIIITPNVGNTDIFDFERKEDMFQVGEEGAKRALPEILQALEKLGL